MKTTPQPEAKAEAKAVSRPARRMRSKGPLQHKGSRPAPRPGGHPPDSPYGQEQLAEGDARGSGGVSMGDSATHGESQETVPLEEHWTTDEDAIDSVGPTPQ